jgi:hypothetical protein
MSGIDLPERAFKAILSGAIVVHDPALDVSRYLPHAVVAKNQNDYHFIIKEILKLGDDSRKELSRVQQLDVLVANTYHHRMATLMMALRFGDVANKLLIRIVSERFSIK